MAHGAEGAGEKVIIPADATEQDVSAHIEAEYLHGRHKSGWSYIYSNQNSRRHPQLVTIGLNPGGGRGDFDWGDDKRLIYKDTDRTVNAYLDQPWGDNSQFTPLQIQIQAMKSRHFRDVKPDHMLSFQLVPFRSPSWDELAHDQRMRATEVGFGLLDWTLANLTTSSTVVAFGLGQFEQRLVGWFRGTDPRTFEVGWGHVTATAWATPFAAKLIFLPHLSRYRIFGRPEFTQESKIFG
ncbi:hypothetical protein CD351_11295 [Erythrobacter sp. KY5]|nr:hypothetical protein CD351_11295 [Erythrobacter sp. KY5]